MSPSLSLAEWQEAQRLLLDLLCPATPARMSEPPSAAQWGVIADEAKRHRVQALTYRRIAARHWMPTVPEPVALALRDAYQKSALRNALLLRQTSHLVAALSNAGISTMLLKGLHLASQVYPEPALRSMADLDIMVQRAQLKAAVQVLVREGYGPAPSGDVDALGERVHHLPRMAKGGAEIIELHHTIELPISPFHIDVDALWDSSRSVQFGGVEARVLSNEHLFLHLCIHLSYHHGFGRAALKGVMDLATILQVHASTFRWPEVVATARAWGAEPFVHCTLKVLSEVLQVRIPSEVFSSLGHTDEDVAAAETAARFILSPPLELPVRRSELPARVATVGVVRAVAAGVFPPRSVLLRNYGGDGLEESTLSLYRRRFMDVLKRRTSTLVQVGLGRQSAFSLTRHLDEQGRLSLWWDRRARGSASVRTDN